MRFILAGKGIRSVVCLKYLLKHGYRPVLVIGQAKDQSGLIKLAKSKKIPTYVPQNINSQIALKKITKYYPDLLVLAGYSQILKAPIINLSKKGTINLHGGPLPAYRGASVLNWQIIQGETIGGISIIFVDEGIDTGDIIAQKKFPIKTTDTIKDVVNKTFKLFPPMLLKVIKQIESNTVKRVPQNKNKGNYWRKRRPADGWFTPQGITSQKAYNFVRALTNPYPGAMVKKGTQSFILWQVNPTKKQPKPNTFYLKTIDGYILVTKYENIS